MKLDKLLFTIFSLSLGSPLFAASESKGILPESSSIEVISWWKISVFLIFIFLLFSYVYKLLNDKGRLNLRRKLSVGLGGLISIFVSIIIYSLIAMNSISKEIEEISKEHIPLTSILTKITEHQLQQEIHLEKYLRTKSDREKDIFLKLSKKVSKEIILGEEIVQKALQFKHTEERTNELEQTLSFLKMIEKKHKDFDLECEKVMSLIVNGVDISNELKNCERLSVELEHDLVAFLDRTDFKTRNSVSLAEAHEKEALNYLISLVCFALVSGLMILLMLWRATIGTLPNISLILANGSESVSDASSTLYENSITLAEMTKQQTGAVQDMAASVEEINAMAKRSANQAKISAQNSIEGTKGVAEGRVIVERMQESIQAISDENDLILERVNESNASISEISKIISEISDKTTVINDIVFQTKLLSFNASVEAARAGEAGKGFSVVAEEIGNLASMSGEAASEISEMLNDSVDKVNAIVDTSSKSIKLQVEGSKNKIKNGVLSSKQCRDVFNEMNSIIEGINRNVNEIATASNEQSMAVQQMNDSIREIDLGAKESSNVTVQIKEFAERLNQESHKLSEASFDLEKLIGIVKV